MASKKKVWRPRPRWTKADCSGHGYHTSRRDKRQGTRKQRNDRAVCEYDHG